MSAIVSFSYLRVSTRVYVRPIGAVLLAAALPTLVGFGLERLAEPGALPAAVVDLALLRRVRSYLFSYSSSLTFLRRTVFSALYPLPDLALANSSRS